MVDKKESDIHHDIGVSKEKLDFLDIIDQIDKEEPS